MFKQLFVLLFRLITQSTPTWQELSGKQDKSNDDFYKGYFFPVVGIIALLSFAGILLADKPFDVHNVQKALKTVIKQLLIYGGSLYITAYTLSEYVFPKFGLDKDRLLSERFTGYTSSLIYVIAMLTALFPGFFFLKIAVFYTVYILWVGASQFLAIREEDLIKFTTFAGTIVLGIPFLVTVLIELMPGMKYI